MLRVEMLQITAAEASLVVGGLDTLSPERYAAADQIVNAGIALGYSPNDIETALRVAYMESRYDVSAVNGSMFGLYQYSPGTWSTLHSFGDRSNPADQINAFYSDLDFFRDRYYAALTEAQRAQVSFEQYVYICHHDGPWYSDYHQDLTQAHGYGGWNYYSGENFSPFLPSCYSSCWYWGCCP